MPYFESVTNLNPHLYLKALERSTVYDKEELAVRRATTLSKTRNFEGIRQAVRSIQNMSFPKIQQKLVQASEVHKREKAELGTVKIGETLGNLEEALRPEDPDEELQDQLLIQLFHTARLQFEEGLYKEAQSLYRKIQKNHLNSFLKLRVPWGRLLCDIALESNEATRSLREVRERIEKIQPDELRGKKHVESQQVLRVQYARREELLNMASLVYFREASFDDMEDFLEMCGERNNLAVVQLICPYLLRYMCVALVLNKSLHRTRGFDLYRLTELLSSKAIKIDDVFVNFFESLLINFDFEQAADLLRSVRKAIQTDFLLVDSQKSIIQGCQHLYCLIYCRIFDSLSLDFISKLIDSSLVEAEAWALQFIRASDIGAKIDTERKLVYTVKKDVNINDKYSELVPAIGSLINQLSKYNK